MIFAMVNFRTGHSVASNVLRCKEAPYRTATSEAKNKLQQQIPRTRGARNRRRVTSSYSKRCNSTWTEFNGRGHKDSTTILFRKQSIQQQIEEEEEEQGGEEEDAEEDKTYN